MIYRNRLNVNILLIISSSHSYAEVRSPGYLHLYKDKAACADAAAKSTEGAVSADASATVMDLKLVMDFKVSVLLDVLDLLRILLQSLFQFFSRL